LLSVASKEVILKSSLSEIDEGAFVLHMMRSSYYLSLIINDHPTLVIATVKSGIQG